ncbi:RNA-directed DNA polymerase [Flavobacterium psychrophilum]|nr:RNA-directed DNA polymerase [Flavobacterium psychrophilum]
MKKSTKKNIDYTKERVVLSDILPYEVPPFFSNRHFYEFIIKNKISIVDYELRFKKEPTNTLEKLIKILFGFIDRKSEKENLEYDYFKLDTKKDVFLTIPFKFKITHKENDFRELTVIHPINQLQLVNFYDKYKYTILNLSEKSRYSLRKPDKVATLKYFKDNTNKKNKSKNSETEIIETSDKEYTSLKTFFSYEKHSNIYKFYESYDYHRAEKKFNNLLKFDISRCFDSLYTHTLPWALSNKKIVKDNLGFNKNTFGNTFDVIMQKMNYNETNGIVIGPEFSRIFAELILQKIDENVEKELHNRGYHYKKNYDIFRYVDDFFVFYSDDKIKNEILNIYKTKLQEYNLFFNDSKTIVYNQPIITNITLAKEEIRKLIEQTMILRFFDKNIKLQVGVKYFKAKDVITNYKLILSNTGTSYKDLQNYFLSTILNKLKNLIATFQDSQGVLLNLYLERKKINEVLFLSIFDDFTQIESNEKLLETEILIEKQIEIIKSYYKQLFTNFNEIVELTFFIYSVLPRVTYSIKVCQILFRIIDFIKNQEKTKQIYYSNRNDINTEDVINIALDFDKKHIVFKNIFDGIYSVFNKSKSSEYSEVETLYLLPIINELGKNYTLNENLIIEHFNIDKTPRINYFTTMSILNHIRKNIKYNTLRKKIRDIIVEKFNDFENNKAEDVFLLIDILMCPYIAITDDEVKKFRKKILDKINFFETGTSLIDKNIIIENINGFYSNGFYQWNGSNYGIELNTKRGHNVY